MKRKIVNARAREIGGFFVIVNDSEEVDVSTAASECGTKECWVAASSVIVYIESMQ